jgi:hypothetical protein
MEVVMETHLPLKPLGSTQQPRQLTTSQAPPHHKEVVMEKQRHRPLKQLGSTQQRPQSPTPQAPEVVMETHLPPKQLGSTQHPP